MSLGTILFVVFLILKLMEKIDWSWFWVILPLFLDLIVFVVVFVVLFTFVGGFTATLAWIARKL